VIASIQQIEGDEGTKETKATVVLRRLRPFVAFDLWERAQ
jgi:hypothetical protein